MYIDLFMNHEEISKSGMPEIHFVFQDSQGSMVAWPPIT